MIKKIVSGGQTGVDRAALDAAIFCGIAHGGWCPKGRRAEDGIIDSKYLLCETPSADYEERTKWNVRDSDGTLIIINGELSGGTLATLVEAKKIGRPNFVFDIQKSLQIKNVAEWLSENKIKILNVAGPRASRSPKIYKEAYEKIVELLKIHRNE